MNDRELSNDERLAALLRAAMNDAAPPDRDFLARLREQSAAAFAAPPTTSPDRPKGSAMLPRLLAALAATAAAAALLVVTTFTNPPAKTGDAPRPEAKTGLAKALEESAAARTLTYRVTTGGDTREVIAEKAGRWREDRAGRATVVSDGEIAWQIDRDGKSRRAGDARLPRNLLEAVLAGTRHKPIDLAKAAPATTEKQGDEEFIVYNLDVEAADGPIKVQARVAEKARTLRSITARAGDKVIGELEVTAVNKELPEEKFAVLNSLSEDGRVGKITDSQGLVAVKPLAQARWTPVGEDFVLMPGDWLRTDIRGANAAAVRLLSRAQVIAGPGTVVEVPKSTQLKLTEGELEISVPQGASVELVGPDDQKVVVKGTQHYYLDRGQRLRLAAREPLWLKGFKGKTANESIGSLVAKVDGRAEPLSVGYHKVTVDIRDQIARTTIEESFVNHTSATLEGVFTFPLPQDASIAEFGMWIGNELVMADVVEKQRAREIYDQIKREKRDPGLLEWSGGNLFTARVWPIFAHSEKRIKITYTQVLPLRGNKYAYSYALQSDMLALNPLRELSLTVNVNSAVPLKKVWSPTHGTRDQMAKNAARVEFTAQEYTPRKDFEVVVEQDARPSDVVMVPHRRGADGYFLLQVMPPAAPQDRAVLADAGPLRLLIVADTSASMDRRQRQQQEAFIAALVSALTPRDTFNLACCDLACDWAFDKPIPADAKNLIAAREMLYKRQSLGWTDLDKAFASVMEAADAGTHVVYVGDGIPVTTSADPVAFAQRLKAMYPGRGTFHAVTTGSTFESGVCKAIASLGGGSWRRVGAEQGPTAVALELLGEMTRPTLRDVKVEFNGLKTASVYPRELPNVPAGTQQILLGRYLPQGNDQQGEVVVTGALDGKPVRMATAVTLRDAEAGNSFIPRLWARMHLDALLERGTSEAVKDEVIALSEEYNILTPYTSFLVLETDADRERFGVKKRFRMRDGEKFFAEGRDLVDFALVQQQMKRAGTWRLNLRRDVLRDLAGLGRNVQTVRREDEFRKAKLSLGKSLEVWDSKTYFRQVDMDGSEAVDSYSALGAAPDFLGRGEQLYDDMLGDLPASSTAQALDTRATGLENRYEPQLTSGAFRPEGYVTPDESGRPLGDEANMDASEDWTGAKGDKKRLYDLAERDGFPGGAPDAEELGLGLKPQEIDGLKREGGFGGRYSDGRYAASGPAPGFGFGPAYEPIGGGLPGRYFIRNPGNAPHYSDSLHWQRQWWGSLLPPLPPAAKAAPARPSSWPEPARKLAQSLLRRDRLKAIKGGLEVVQKSQAFNPRYDEVASRAQRVELYAPTQWLARSADDGSQTIIQWCTQQERGLIHRAFGVGRVRPAKPEDLEHWPVGDHSVTPLDESYRNYTASVEDAGKERARLVLKHLQSEVRLLLDTARGVVLEIEHRSGGKVQATTKYDEFVLAAGGWWATKSESFDEKGRRTGVTVLTIKDLSSEQFAARVKEELAGREQVLFVKAPLPRLADARKALAAGKAGLEEHVTLMQYYTAIQQWTKAREHLEAVEKLTDKPAKRWLRDAITQLSRRFDEFHKRFLAEATSLAESKLPANDAYALARFIQERAAQVNHPAEMLPLLDKLEPVYRRQPAHLHAMKDLTRQRAYGLQNLGRNVESRALLRQLAESYPRDESLQREFAQSLFNEGDYPAGYAWIEKALAASPLWQEWEEETLRNVTVQYLTQQGRVEELLKYAAAWMSRKPATRTPYAIHLATLIRLDKEGEANATLAKWLKEGMVRGEMKPEVSGRLGAAIAQAMGQGYNMYTNRIEERWLADLVAVAKFFAHDERNGHFADQAMQLLQHNQADEAIQLRRDLAADLLKAAPTLAPHRLDRLLNWLINAHNDAAYWPRLAAVLRQRWDGEKDRSIKAAVGGALVTVLRSRSTPDELMAFLREQMRAAEPAQRPGYARQLFDTLLAQPWQAKYEDEAFALLHELAPDDGGVTPPRTPVEALYQLTDRMVAARAAALNQKIDRPDKLPRTELRNRQAENLKNARTEFADRLAKEFPRAPKDLAPWVKMERMYLDVVLDRNTAQVEADCWEIVGSEPPRPADPDAEPKPGAALEGLLKERAFVTLNYLATRRKADPKLVDRLLAYIDRGIAQEGEGNAWKLAKHRLLVAADRPKDLDKGLKEWVEKSPTPNVWRLHLGFLQAELGKLREAVGLFEIIKKDGELGPLAFRSLADWYVVLNEKEKHEQALLDQYRFTEEHQLSRMIYARLYPWQRGDGHLPGELDKDVLRLFAVLFEKSAQPANYVSQLGQFYQASRDFRLLAVLADAVVGQTPVKVYPFLQNMGSVLGQIQDEAVVDELIAQLDKTRKNARTPVDQRALDLMEMLVRRKAAELKNQPDPHGNAAVAAMKRAFDRAWADGEQPLMAQMLYSLGTIAYKPLADEQVRESKWLYERQKKAGYERLRVGHYYALVLGGYGRLQPAIDVLTAELGDYLAARGTGVMPPDANEMIGTLVSYYRQARRHADGEAYLLERLKKPGNDEQRIWYTEQLNNHYLDALASDGEVSLGRGVAIYPALEKKLRKDSAEPNPYHQYRMVSIAMNVYGAAKQKAVGAWADDLRSFANKLLPEVLKTQHSYYESIVNQVANTIHNLLGPVDAIEFVLNRVEKEPEWMRLSGQDGWSRHGGSLAVWRTEARNIGELEPRLLKLVLKELRRDLETRQSRTRSIYYKTYAYYWAEKEPEFIKVAEEVYEKRSKSAAHVVYVADYFYHGVGKPARAIEVLYAALEGKLLDDMGIATLVRYLREQSRHAEAVALLEPFVTKYPHVMNYRVWLMNSYFHTRRPDKLRALLKDTHAYFHAENRWNEGVCAALAHSTLENELWAEAAEYYKECIALRQRSAPNRGIGEGTLATYYANQATAYSKLGKTEEAVEAASGAVVAWPAGHHSRQHYLDRLRQVLVEARDIDAFAAGLDRREKESGQGSPVVRKALAKAYQSRGQFAAAAAQYRAALELQPEDYESHDQLIACHDQLNDKEGAVAATLEAIHLARRNIALYRTLGDRLKALDRGHDAERAYTSIVEVQPNEAESHTLLAQVRQQQSRLEDAAAHWEQAAKLRALEPTALIELARVQLALKQWDKADATVTKLEKTTWPARFDAQRQSIHQLRERLKGQRK